MAAIFFLAIRNPDPNPFFQQPRPFYTKENIFYMLLIHKIVWSSRKVQTIQNLD
jgi:hypothetical protein